MSKFLLIFLSLLFLFSCSDSNYNSDINIPATSEVETLIEHSKEFEKKVLSYETPGGRIHFAIGFGIANSIMVEGENGNIIIDAADSVYEAEQIYSLFSEKNDNPIKAIIYTHNHGDHTFGAAYYLKSQNEKPQIIAHEDTSEEKLESWREVVPLNKETDIKTAEEEILDTYDIDKLRSIIEHGFPNALDGDDSSKPIKTLSFFGKYEEEIMEYFYNYSDELALQIWGNNTLDIYGYKHECDSTFIELVATKTIERLEGEG